MKDEKINLVSDENDDGEVRPIPLDFTEEVGGNGRWQILLLVLTTLATIPSALNHLAITFLATPEDHWCTRPLGSNLTLEKWWTHGIPKVTVHGEVQHSHCERFQNNGSDFGNRTEVCEMWEYSSEFNSIVEEWDLVCENEWMISASQSVYMSGFLFAGVISGQLSDIYGRQKVSFVTIGIFLLSGFATAFAPSFLVFTITRFFIAFGYSAFGLTQFVLMIESVGEPYRANFGLLQGIGWNIGYLVLPLLAWWTDDWVTLQLIVTLPSVLIISFFWWLPESPRWLLTKGSFGKTKKIMQDIARMNRRHVEDLDVKVNFWRKSIKVNDDVSQTTVLDLLRTPTLRKCTLCLNYIWIVVAFIYYGLSLNTNDLQGNMYINFFLCGAVEIPGIIFCFLTINRFGRKKPLIFSLIFAGVTCISCIFIPEELWKLRTALAMCGKLFVSSAFGIIYVYSAEIFPTVARNVGIGTCSTMARFGSSIAPFMKDLGKVTDPSLPLVLFGIFSISSGFVVMLLPETKDQPVPETLTQAEELKE